MVCIYCGSATQVINSRAQKRLNQVWRRRQCVVCGSVMTTHEATDLGATLRVAKNRDGKRAPALQPFDRDHLFVSIYESCRHRPEAITDAAALVQTVLAELRPKIQEGTVTRETLVEATKQVLERFDAVAATMYQAYHPPTA
jgi:transcriptional regulator NrdR family protein